MANDRIYYAIQQVAFAGNSVGQDPDNYFAAHGVQSVSIETSYNLDQVFELGQLAIYENVEGIPEVTVTLQKVLDGYIPLYCLATADQQNGPNLVNRGKAQCRVQLGIWEDTSESAGGDSLSSSAFCEMSGMYVSSIAYTFGADGNFTEDITLVGNDKVWGTGQALNFVDGDILPEQGFASGYDGEFASNDDAPFTPSGGVQQRQEMIFAKTLDNASGVDRHDYGILPIDIFGISSSGENSGSAHISNINVSVSVGRDDLFELGSRKPYARPQQFPLEVTTTIDVISTSGDLMGAFADGPAGTACQTPALLKDREIRLATCEGLRLYLGTKNRLSSVSYGGGDAGGGNVTVSYNYTNFNDFTVIHSGDVTGSGGSVSGFDWWADRATNGYLGA